MKRANTLLTIGFILFLSISLVSAYSWYQTPREGAEQIVDTVINILEPFAGALFGGFGSENLFISVLFFIIILALVYVILGRIELFEGKKPIIWVVTISIALLATRFTANWMWVQFVLLPYNILGIALLSIIPLIIYFFFITSFDSGTIRKFGWALFIALYIGLWYSNFDEIGDMAYIYLFAGILGFIMLLSDKYVRGWIIRSAIMKGLTPELTAEIIKVQREIKEKTNLMSSANFSQRKIISNQIDNLKATEKYIARELRKR